MAKSFRRRLLLGSLVVLLALLAAVVPAPARKAPRVQELTGHLEIKESEFYSLPGLKQGQTLYVYVQGTSNNLDPFAALLKPGLDLNTVEADYIAEEKRLVASGRDPLVVIPELLSKFTLAWDDDGGSGYDAAFQFKVKTSGDYHLIVTSSLARETYGNYRLLIGLNTPAVLTGRAPPTGAPLASHYRLVRRTGPEVEEVTNSLSPKETFRFYPLRPMRAGETLYVFVQALTGNLHPRVGLYDYGEKPLASANFAGKEKHGACSYKFSEEQRNCRLKISSGQVNGALTFGDFRLVLGVGLPAVLTGKVKGRGHEIIQGPTPVQIGLKLQEITNVDQRSENFSVVATLALKWRTPELAFSPDTIQNRVKIFTGERFLQHAHDNNIIVPLFTIFNQQGRRWTQNSAAVVWPDGEVEYFERFTTTLQAPDFDFRAFPFDQQKFFIRVDNLFPEWNFVYTNLPGYSEVGSDLGEEEWVVTNHNILFSSVSASIDRPVSRFSFGFTAKRHITYYFFRILLPLGIIIIVAWFSFFLKDYNKRVDVAGANLLIFIAFNFTIATDIPRLGYLTFLDTILVTTFMITGVMVIIAYQLRRMVIEGKEANVLRIDKYIRWLYPVAYLVGIGSVTYLFG